MKTINSLLCVGLAGLIIVASAGCSKKKTEAGPKTLQDCVAGLSAALASASPEVQSNYYNGVSHGLRYGDYNSALAGLQRLDGDSSLNAQQKQAVDDTIQAVQRTMASQQTTPAQ